MAKIRHCAEIFGQTLAFSDGLQDPDLPFSALDDAVSHRQPVFSRARANPPPHGEGGGVDRKKVSCRLTRVKHADR